MTTVYDIKLRNRQAGHFFFEPSTMRFFRSKVLPTVVDHGDLCYFVTSEQRESYTPRLYTVRVMDKNGHVSTVGEFQGYTTAKAAHKAIRDLLAY